VVDDFHQVKFNYLFSNNKIIFSNADILSFFRSSSLFLNSPHYVVFEGIENEIAFLADPIRGKIHLAYDELIKEGINDEHKLWAVMSIKASANKPKDSTLYLSTDKYDTHFTTDQSGVITLATIARANQLMVNYDFFTEIGSARNDNLTRQTRNFSHRLGVRYGITANTEIGGNIAYFDNREQLNNVANESMISNSSNRRYEIYANHRFSLDDAGRNGIILGAGGTFGEYASIWGGNINLTAYTNTAFAQFSAGGSINKQVSSNNLVNNGLPDFQFSGFVSANKPIGERYNASLTFAVNNDYNRYLPASEFNRVYSVSTGLTYVINPSFQVTPSLGYSFGNNSGDSFVFGASLIYTGGW
jgi:hypothetical protein